MGLLQRLFGLKEKKEEGNTIKSKQPSDAYFLDSDSSKTFGNIDYMRQPKAVERTFPKVEGMNVGGLRKISQFSSDGEQLVYDGDGKPSNSTSTTSAARESSSTSSSSSAPVTSTPKRTPSSTGDLDFRSMARDIKR